MKSYNSLELFAYGSYEEYEKNPGSFIDMSPAMIKKLKQLSIISLAMENKIIPYTTLQEKLKVDNVRALEDLIIETIYAQYLRESDDFDLSVAPTRILPRIGPDEPIDMENLGVTRHSISLGMEWDWPVVQGRGFQTRGHRERAWVFTSNEAWGSDVDFSQIYLSTRWEIPLGERWKILARGEIGYTDADVFEEELKPHVVLSGRAASGEGANGVNDIVRGN